MKTIKVILSIISALVLAFFLTGLIVKETNYSAEISVNKPLKEVFKLFNEPGNVQQWIPEIKSIDTLKLNPSFTGSEFKMVVDNQGQEITMIEKIMAYVPNEKITLFFDAENMLKTDNYVFTEKDGHTIITLNSSCQSDSYIMACMFPYFEGVFQEQDQTYLNNFKAYAEKQ